LFFKYKYYTYNTNKRERYGENTEKIKETTKQYQKRQRDIYQIIKELVKNDRLDEVIQDEEVRTKIKEVFSEKN